MSAPDTALPFPHDNPGKLKSWRKAQRERLIGDRMEIAMATRKAHADAIDAALRDLISAPEGLTVSCYWPIRCEPDLRPLARWVIEGGGRFALPVVVVRARPLVFRTWQPGETMERGFWNIPVPSSGEEVVPDVVISPLVGFDTQGYRLGYGGGYYDRTLAALPRRAKVLGVGYEIARLDTIHPQPHDIPMDVIVTEKGISIQRT